MTLGRRGWTKKGQKVSKTTLVAQPVLAARNSGCAAHASLASHWHALGQKKWHNAGNVIDKGV